jgi:hypothetical protein
MAPCPAERHGGTMLFAGAIDVPTELVFAILAGLAIAGALVSATGGLVAWLLCRQRRAFWLGSLAFAIVAVVAVANGGRMA